MKGNNKLLLNGATMNEAMECYLRKIMINSKIEVVSVKLSSLDKLTFEVSIRTKETNKKEELN